MFKLPLRRSVNDETVVEDVITLDTLPQAVRALGDAVLKNEQMRSKYANNPDKFMESEERLFVAVKTFLSISTDEECLVALVESDFIHLILPLLAYHENIDIALAVIEVLNDFLEEDPDVDPAVPRQLAIALDANHFFEMLGHFCSKCNEDDEVAFEVMRLFESMMELCVEVMKPKEALGPFFPWLLTWFFCEQSLPARNYSAELISSALLLDERLVDDFISCDGTYCLVTVLCTGSVGNADEGEFLENAYAILATLCLVHGPDWTIRKDIYIALNRADVWSVLISLAKKGKSENAIKAVANLLQNEATVGDFVAAGGLGLAFGLLERASRKSEELVCILAMTALFIDDCSRFMKKVEEPGKRDRISQLPDGPHLWILQRVINGKCIDGRLQAYAKGLDESSHLRRSIEALQ